MAIDLESALQRYVDFYQTMTLERVEELRELLASDIHFRDPFNDFHGVEKVIKVMRDMYRDSENPVFTIVSKMRREEVAFLKWEMTFTPKRIPSKTPWRIVGISEVHFDEDGKVSEHLDYWDAATYFYERLPVLGFLIRLVKKRLSV
jgi:steroid delta-isomerase